MSDKAGSRPVVLITGAARRVGAVTSRVLHQAGYDLALHCRHSRGELDSLIGELENQRAGSTLALQADLADFARLPDLIEATIRRFGRLDGLVNNASTFQPSRFGEVDQAHWDDIFASNARAPYFLCQAAAAALREREGVIVNMLDIYVERPLPGYSVYCMAKAAQAAMTRALAQELGPRIRVNGIAPGAVLWPEDGMASDRQDAIVARTPLKRAGKPQDVASTVLWLLRDAGFVTGQVIAVDGGRSVAL